MATLVKTTQDGRKVEVVGPAVTLGGKLEAMELTSVTDHPNRAAILKAAPDAAFMAGRVTLTAEEAKIAQAALDVGHKEYFANPKAIEERFRSAANRREAELGIE
ncbi:hypothetical protein [Rhodoblastus sp.]|uniref:hypothetical protein n=1 Tax=Rhodoblastus sp. TaxID=1962975 RepID=UPI003F947C89